MNKGELVEAIAEDSDVSRSTAQRALNSVLSRIQDELKGGGSVSIPGFGTFLVRDRAAREGINPQNPGQKIQIPARRVPAFKPGKGLKDAVS